MQVKGYDPDCWLDGFDRALEHAYEAFPWRLLVVDTEDMSVAHLSAPGPVNGLAKARALRAYLAAGI